MKTNRKAKYMADGGVLKETPEQMMARMNAKYGLGGAGTSPTQPKPADKQQPPAQPQRPTPAQREGLADAIGRRNEELKKAANYAEGGIIPVDIGRGLVQAIAQPLAEDWRQGNQAIKAMRDQYPTADAIAGIHPGVAAAQVANDVMAGDVGADTAGNVAQMIPIVRQANILTKGSVAIPGMGRVAVNMPATIKKNTAITAAQTLGQPANAYARGGIMPVMGIGSGTSDSIPVVVAGQRVNLSNGEGAAILPARTMKNKAAVHAIEEIIEATNGKPPVQNDDEGAEGMACGGIAGKRRMFAGGILGQQNESSISGVRRIGNSFTQTDAGPSSDSAPAATAPATSPLPQLGASLQPAAQSPTTGVVRSGNSFSAAPAVPAVAGQMSTSAVPATQAPAVAPVAPVAQPVAPQQSAAGKDAYGNSTALTQQYQRELDALRAPAKAFVDGGVKSKDELKRKMTDYVVPTPAPTAQEVYAPVNRAAGGIAGAFNSLPEGGVIKRAVAEGESVPTAIGRAIVEGGGMPNNGLFGPPDAKPPASMQVAQPSPAAPVPASPASVPAVAPQPLSQAPVTPVPQQAAFSNEGRLSAIRSVATGIGDTGNASLNPQTGIMAFTDKTFDPTKQKFEPGAGAITNPKTGKTMVLTGADQSAGAAQPAGALAAGRDAYGNSTAITQQLKGELAAVQADNDQAYTKQSAGLRKGIADSQDYYKRVQGEADRFNRFVNESSAAAIARDLASGGGTARTNAGKIAALHELQSGNVAAQSGQTARDLAATSGANQLAVVGAQGENQLANTTLSGQNQLAVEDLRQSGPEKTLRATKLQGEVEDANAQRAARQGLMSAIDAGNPTATEKAWRRGIAAGIVNPEKPTPYRFHTDPMGNGVRVNEATGATDVLDRATNTWKPVSATEPAPREPANRKTGQTYQTPNGPMIWRGTGWEPVQAR